jgi:hypothetical protein
MISFGGHGENRGSNLMENKYNICTFSLVTIPNILLYFNGDARKKFGNHWPMALSPRQTYDVPQSLVYEYRYTFIALCQVICKFTH